MRRARPSGALKRLLATGVFAAIVGFTFLILRVSRDVSSDTTHPTTTPAPAIAPGKANIRYEDARPILEARPPALPTALTGKTPAEIESAWPGWVSKHHEEIRARLARGDEDSLVNYWLYGTTFTTLPRATARGMGRLSQARAEELLLGRLDDLVTGLASTGADERLQFARQVVVRQGIDPTTPDGRERTKVYLVEARARVLADNDRYLRTAQSAQQLKDRDAALAAYATVYQDRGLSSDTSLRADFGIEQALDALKSSGRIEAARVRRVAIIGPGLDFTDKAEGYDFYPQQTIQPFAVIDSLMRLGLASPADFHLTTLDVNPRVNQHMERARQRAQNGDAYVLQLPLNADSAERQWHPDLVSYWQRLGERIGEDVEAMAAPPGAAGVRVRAVRVRPAVVMSITPQDLNVVLERLDPLADDERFDLVVATNVLVYYDAFEQSLALANVSGMLRPGGFLLTNYAVFPVAPMETSASLMTMAYFDRQQQNGDTLFWYQRK